jgi:uncharacterized membrane protein YtjA (UPF0391 family)
MTGTGLIITLIETVLSLSGIQFETGGVAAAVNGVVVFVGFVLMIWGQVRRKDLVLGLIRKA